MKHNIKSEWILANAGSGKTTHLTKRVLRLLVLGVPPERIVCITYTKAAASEMRARVLASLRDLFIADDATRRKKLEVLLERAAEQSECERAQQLFASLLDSPTGGIQLTTIHGFCQTILRRFPLEAGIVPHFTVLDEAAADELLRAAKQALLRDARHDAALPEALALLGARGGESRFDSLTADSVKQKALWKRVWHLQSPAALREKLWALNGLAPNTTSETLRAQLLASLGDEAEALLRQHLPALLAHPTATYREFAQTLGAWLAQDMPQRTANIEAFWQMFLTQSFGLRKRMLDGKQHPEGSPLQMLIAHWQALAVESHARHAALACAEETYAVAVLAQALEKRYSEAKEAAHALDYDDLIARTLDLLLAPEMMGWVMSKLDHRIDHLLIDEAQDNSAGQWRLAQLLVDELMATSEGAGSAGVARSLLVVGDEKQSIYSFQGAAPEEFSRYQQSFKALLAASASPLVEVTLAHSYRSTPAVLRVVDAVCAQPHVAATLSAQGSISAHVITRGADAGSVVLYPPVLVALKHSFPALEIPKDYAHSQSAAQVLAETIAQTIADWLSAKRQLPSQGRPIEAGDILIVVRKRTRIVQALIRALERRNVPVAGMDRLVLAQHLAVKDVLALMRWCLNEADDLALAHVLRSPLVGMSDEGLREVAHGRSGSLWQAISNPWLAAVRARRYLAPYDFLTFILEVSERRAAFATRFGEEVHEILDELKGQAALMPASMPPSLAHFYDWMSSSNRQIKRESEAASTRLLRIMTVHGAKGLEAPIVILADTVDVPHTGRELVFGVTSAEGLPLAALSISAISKHAPCLLSAKETKKQAIVAEYNRLLYVALTRARDELHVFGTASDPSKMNAESWYALVAAAMKACHAETLEGGALRVADLPSALASMRVMAEVAPVAALPAWAKQNPSDEAHGVATITPSATQVGQAKPYGATTSDARARGVRIHRVLELVDAGSDAASVAQLVAFINPDWDAPAQVELSRSIGVLQANEPWLWAGQRMVEASICGSIMLDGQAVAVSGQMDVMLRTDAHIILVDYKTGASVPASADEVSLHYVLQMKLYHALVTQLYPSMRVRCAIVWTHAPCVMWLDEQVKTTPFPEKNVMLEAGIAA